MEPRISLERFSTTLTERLRACESEEDLCQMVGSFCHELLPNDVIVVSLYDPDRDMITVRGHHGLGNGLERILAVLRVDPTQMTFSAQDMLPEARARYCTGRLEPVPDGLYELATHSIPRRLCDAAQSLIGIKAVFIVGFGRDDDPRGGLTIFSRSSSPPDNAPQIELLSGMVALALRQRIAEHDRSRLERQLQQTQKLEAIGQLAGGVAHDYNNTLQGIRILAEQMRLDLEPENAHYEPLSELLTAVDHATEMTRSLLDIGRRQHQSLGPLELGELVADTQPLLQRILRDDIVLRCPATDTALYIQGDAVALKRLLLNTAINAQDAMPGGGTLTIAASAGDEEGHARLLIEDTGHGMPPDVVQRAFEPFFTTKPSDQGTGVGLASVYGIVKQHDGQITLDSAPGQGTRLTILLPLTDEVPETLLRAPQSEPDQLASSKGWILLVDDEPLVRRVIRNILGRRGWTVVEASDGETALERCSDHSTPPCLLLTDITMPGMSGRQLLGELRTRHPGLPAVLMSGYAHDPDEDMAENPKAHFLAKPFSLQDLEATLGRVLAEAEDGQG